MLLPGPNAAQMGALLRKAVGTQRGPGQGCEWGVARTLSTPSSQGSPSPHFPLKPSQPQALGQKVGFSFGGSETGLHRYRARTDSRSLLSCPAASSGSVHPGWVSAWQARVGDSARGLQRAFRSPGGQTPVVAGVTRRPPARRHARAGESRVNLPLLPGVPFSQNPQSVVLRKSGGGRWSRGKAILPALSCP